MPRQPYSAAVQSDGEERLHPSLLRREGLGERWSSLWLKGDGGIRKKLLHNIPIIPLRIPTHLPYFSVIQFMNTHIINQILPLLLMESTSQGITQENTVITILTRHPSLNPTPEVAKHRQLTLHDSVPSTFSVITG